MKLVLYVLLFLTSGFCMTGQIEKGNKIELGVAIGKSFLSYGDIWGIDRNITLSYGSKWFVGFNYGFGNYEASRYTQDYYEELTNSTVVSKHLNSFLGASAIKFAFGYEQLDVIDIMTSIESYQLTLGRRFYFYNSRFNINVYGNIGIYNFTTIAPDFEIHGTEISNAFFTLQDVSIIGSFHINFMDICYGFGTEFGYSILKDRLNLNFNANARLGDVRVFTVGIGLKTII